MRDLRTKVLAGVLAVGLGMGLSPQARGFLFEPDANAPSRPPEAAQAFTPGTLTHHLDEARRLAGHKAEGLVLANRLVSLGELEVRAGRPQHARQFVADIQAMLPQARDFQRSSLLEAQARLLIQAQAYDEALAIIDTMKGNIITQQMLLENLLLVMTRRDDLPRARHYALFHYPSDSARASSYVKVAGQLVAMGKLHAAQNFIRDVLDLAPLHVKAPAFTAMARGWQESGDAESAIQLMQGLVTLLERDPVASNALLTMPVAVRGYLDIGRADLAGAYLQQAMDKLQTVQVSAFQKDTLYADLAISHVRLGQVAQARQLLAAMTRDKDKAAVVLAMARMALDRGQESDALALLPELGRLAESDLHTLVATHHLQRGDLAAAFKAYDRIDQYSQARTGLIRPLAAGLRRKNQTAALQRWAAQLVKPEQRFALELGVIDALAEAAAQP